MTEIAAKKDKEEKARVDELYREWEAGRDEFTAAEIFGSNTIAKTLSEKPLSYYDSFEETNSKLSLSCLLTPHVLVNVCPLCSCNANPSLIKPYLERGFVLPILNSDLAKYKPKFIDLMIQYPYIGAEAFAFLSDASPYTASVLCEHCFDKEWHRILAKIAKPELPEKERERVSRLFQAQVAMSDPTEQEVIVLRQMKEAADQGDIESVLSLAQKGMLISKLKYPRVFNAIPQVDQSDLRNINIISKELGLPLEQAIYELQEKELAVKGLRLDYDPKRPVEEYLDIIVPRRKKINALIKELIEQGSKNKQISQINDKLWEINRDVVTSKSLESISFLTNLVTDNLNIVTSLLVGALVGYSSAELVGCGIGSAGGMLLGTFSKKLSQHVNAKMPSIPRKTVEWMKAQLESPQEKMLSLMLSKDIKTIQVWQLRRKFEET